MKDIFKSLKPQKVISVDLEGNTVYIKELNARQSMEITKKKGDTLDYLTLSICTEEGEPVFDSKTEGRRILGEISMHALTILMAEFNKLNGFDESQEETEKNSDEIPPDDSSSNSQLSTESSRPSLKSA